MAEFSQLPTLGEFIEVARASPYRFTKVTWNVPDAGRIVYLRRVIGGMEQIIDLPPGPQTQRLARHPLVGLCRKAQIRLEDFGIRPDPWDFVDC